MWPFKRKPAPSHGPADCRDWNEDWKVGDTAECIVDGIELRWAEDFPPWERPALGQKLIVSGFMEAQATDNTLRYWLKFEDWPVPCTTSAFRKLRSIAAEESEVVNRILKAPKPGKDRVREDA